MTERMLGIVGGVGPESTADYYRRLIDRWRERGPDNTYPSILLNSLNSRPVLDAFLAGDLDPTVSLFDASVARPRGRGRRAGDRRAGEPCLQGSWSCAASSRSRTTRRGRRRWSTPSGYFAAST